MTNAITTEMRKTGIDIIGDMPWGTHFCLFYEGKTDLLDALIPYCKAGLENQEFCLWVVAPPLTVEIATRELQQATPEFDRYSLDGSIEIVAAHDWYLEGTTFDLKRVVAAWHEKLKYASAKGYVGVRVTGDTAWLRKKDWKDFCEYEDSLNGSIANKHLAVLCTYPIASCGAREILDVVRTHQFAATRRREGWEVIETAGYKQAKAEIKRLNDELEQRVLDRTNQLTTTNEELRKEICQRQHAEETLRRTQGKLIEVQEEERTRIARELHDDVSQQLALLAVELDQWDQSVTHDSDFREHIQHARRRIGEIGQDVQEVAHQLHSSKLEYLGLVAAAKCLSKEISEKNHIRVDFTEVGVPRTLRNEVSLTLFRILQEALQNVVEHSNVKNVEVRLWKESNELHLTVKDSGRGFDPPSAMQGAGLGLTSMRERARLVNGNIAIESKPMGGTTIHVRVPFDSEVYSRRQAV